MRTTDSVFMIEPVAFAYNRDAAQSNSFMTEPDLGAHEVQEAALAEFNGFAGLLNDAGVNVIRFRDTKEPHTPDSIFPNNWISTHAEGYLCTYPMEAPSRRAERREDVVQKLLSDSGYRMVIDFSPEERYGIFLEGTGSLVLDRDKRVAYANKSSRMSETVLKDWVAATGYFAVTFASERKDGGSIYHTNVLMALGESTAVVCPDVVPDHSEKSHLLASLIKDYQRVIEITEEQMDAFAGNMLQLQTPAGLVWAMSTCAFNALDQEQLRALRTDSEIVHAPLDTIESVGGGSARCMLAEVFRPGKTN